MHLSTDTERTGRLQRPHGPIGREQKRHLHRDSRALIQQWAYFSDHAVAKPDQLGTERPDTLFVVHFLSQNPLHNTGNVFAQPTIDHGLHQGCQRNFQIRTLPDIGRRLLFLDRF